MRRRRHPQQTGRARLDVAAQPPGFGCRAEDRDVPCMGDRGRDRAETDPLDHAHPARELDAIGREGLPAIVGLGTGQDEQITLAEPNATDHELGPGQLGEPTVDDLQRRAPRPIVEERVRIECRDVDRVVE